MREDSSFEFVKWRPKNPRQSDAQGRAKGPWLVLARHRGKVKVRPLAGPFETGMHAVLDRHGWVIWLEPGQVTEACRG
ncbi:hypothetical protein [Roseomonas indoligenes]|uniref:hypothetical protein n=1 Tax=Roseomonas indoligenes TaxID=2820811 RepID=UPI001AE0652D|nr:hypothetical protein [Pararoseomonas indoligenes]